jgi:hypothetical protein
MYKLLLFSTLLLVLTTGCAGYHYTGRSGESVSLYLRLPDAAKVRFASSIDGYQLHDVRKNALGFWQISMPLTAESTYFYIVDGAVYIPDCRFREIDDFGSENCLYLP